MGNIRSTIGGAFSALGTSLIGIGVIPQLAGTPNKILLWVAVAGFFCQALGTFLSNLLAADARTVAALADQVNANAQAIITGDKTAIVKTAADNAAKP